MGAYSSPKKTKKIMIGSNEYVLVKQSLAFKDVAPYIEQIQTGTLDPKILIPFLQGIIVDWEVFDGEDKVPFSLEEVSNLSFEAMLAIIDNLDSLMGIEDLKKNNPQLSESLDMALQKKNTDMTSSGTTE